MKLICVHSRAEAPQAAPLDMGQGSREQSFRIDKPVLRLVSSR